jgi:hypothetical protein
LINLSALTADPAIAFLLAKIPADWEYVQVKKRRISLKIPLEIFFSILLTRICIAPHL